MAKHIEINSSKNEIREFKKSIMWRDIKRELTTWKKGFRMEREGIVDDAASSNPSTASVLLHLGDINGRIKAVDYLLSMPDIFIQILEGEKDDSRHKQTD